jgi:hypothetical protein
MENQPSYIRIILEKIVIPVLAFGFVLWLIPRWPPILLLILFCFVIVIIISATDFWKKGS